MPKDFHYDGFAAPTYTQVPDEVFDVLAPELTEAELRVLLYVVRRTFGFGKKDGDAISVNQMVNGIRTKDGRVLDKGTGMSRSAVWRGATGLVKKGVMDVQRVQSAEGDYETNVYRLHFRSEGVSLQERHPYSPKEQPVSLQKRQQETVLQETVLHHSNIRNAEHGKVSLGNEFDGAEEQAAGPTTLATSPPRRAKPEQLARRGAAEPEAIGETLKRRRGRPPATAESSEDREVIVAYLADFARELNDQAPLRVSVSRALNLLARSGLPREVFVQRMYEARSLVKEYSASIQTTVKRNGSPMPVKAKMAYFFAVLEDLVGLKADRPDDGVAPVPPN